MTKHTVFMMYNEHIIKYTICLLFFFLFRSLQNLPLCDRIYDSLQDDWFVFVAFEYFIVRNAEK